MTGRDAFFLRFQSGVQVQTPRFCVPNPTPRPRSARSTTFSFTQDLLKRKKRRSRGVKPGIAETATLSWFQKEIIVSKRMMLHESYHDTKRYKSLKHVFKQKEEKKHYDLWLMTFDSYRRMRIHPRYKMFREKNIEDPFSRTCSNFCFPKIGSQQLKNSFFKKMVSSNNLLQQILVPTSWFVYLKILSATSPSFHRTVPPGDEVTSWPDGGNFFWKKKHGPFCVWIQTTNLYPQNKTKIFWQTFKKKFETLYKNYTFMEKMSKHHHFPKIISGKPHRFRPLTSGVGSSTVTGGGSKHFWMNRCTAARGSADNSNLKASTNSWFCWRDWLLKFPVEKSHELISEEELCHGFELNMKSVVNLNFENTINLNAWLGAKGLGGSWKSCQAWETSLNIAYW